MMRTDRLPVFSGINLKRAICELSSKNFAYAYRSAKLGPYACARAAEKPAFIGFGMAQPFNSRANSKSKGKME